MRKLSLSLIALASLGLALPAAALSASQTVETEKVVVAADGTETLIRTAAEAVKPGDRVVYSLNVDNDGFEPVTYLVLTMPVPSEIKFIEGSEAKTGSVVTFSVDGGDSFMPRDALTVVTINGESRVADTSDISHIRWRVAGPIAAGETDVLSFKGVLK